MISLNNDCNYLICINIKLTKDKNLIKKLEK